MMTGRRYMISGRVESRHRGSACCGLGKKVPLDMERGV